MEIVRITLNDQEEKAFNAYAKSYNLSLEDLFKKALEEKIEDQLDLESIRKHEEDIKNGDVGTFSHDEVKRRLKL